MKTFKNMASTKTLSLLQQSPGYSSFTLTLTDLLKQGTRPKDLLRAMEQVLTACAEDLANAENLPTTDSVSSKVSLKVPSHHPRFQSSVSFNKMTPSQDSQNSGISRKKQYRRDNPMSMSLTNFSEFSHIKSSSTFSKAPKTTRTEVVSPGPATYHCRVSLISVNSPTIPRGGKRVELAKKEVVPGPGAYKPMHYAKSRRS
jgi:hypothetical protein